MGVYIGIGCGDYGVDGAPFPGADKILKVYGSVEETVGIHHIDGLDIIVLCGLLNKLLHGILDAGSCPDLNVVGAHDGSDLILVEGGEKGDVMLGVIVKELYEGGPLSLWQGFEILGGLVCLKIAEDSNLLLYADLSQICGDVLCVFENVCKGLGIQNAVQLSSIFRGKPVHGLCNIVFMIIHDLFLEGHGRNVALDYFHKLTSIVWMLVALNFWIHFLYLQN